MYKKPDGTIYYGPEPPAEGETTIEDLTRISNTVAVSNTAGDMIITDPTNECLGRFNQSVRCDFDYVNTYPTVSMNDTKILDSTDVKIEDNVTSTNGLNVVGSSNVTLGSA